MKYLEVTSLEDVNRLNKEQGYKIHTKTVTMQPFADGSSTLHTVYLLSLSSEKTYDDITNLKDVSPEEVDKYLAEGWKVADSWSKSIRMVKPRDPDEWIHVDDIPDWCASNEYIHIDEAYEHVCDNPPSRGI